MFQVTGQAIHRAYKNSGIGQPRDGRPNSNSHITLRINQVAPCHPTRHNSIYPYCCATTKKFSLQFFAATVIATKSLGLAISLIQPDKI
jgi:hypothetical protein